MFMSLILLSILLQSMSFSQEPTSAIPGGELLAPGEAFTRQDQTILDAQLYMPETFSPTDVIPPGRDRESMLDYTDTEQKTQPIFWGGLALGGKYGQFDKLPYTDIYLSPYLQIWKLFLMYEAPLRFDWNGAFVSRMWNSEAALVSKIEADFYYAKTNHIFRHVQASVYQGEDLFLGHGRFFYDYNPNMYSPYEPFKTFKFSLDASYIGLDYILANIAQPDLMSAEVFIRPLAWIKNPKYAFYKDFKIYGVYGVDLDPFQGFSTDLYEFATSGSTSLAFCMFEVGMDLPIYKTPNDIFAVSIFGDYTYFLMDSSSGISGGFIMDFFEKMPIRFEVSQALGYWEPRWVNVFYYVDRPFVIDDTATRVNKYMTITPDLTYFTGAIGFNWVEKAIFAQAEVYGDFSGENLWITLSFTMGNVIIDKLSFSAYWTVRNFKDIQYYDEMYNPEDNVVDLRLKYHMMPNMYWGLIMKFTGRVAESFDDDDNPIIETTPFTFLGLDFAFRF